MQLTQISDSWIASKSLAKRSQEHTNRLMEAAGGPRQPVEVPRRLQMRESFAPVQRNATSEAPTRTPGGP